MQWGSAEVTDGVRAGDVLAGKYRVEKVLGAGGMGIVVAAHHIQLDEKVAIKLLLPEALANEEAVARFAREARAAVKIKSEHVARVADVGTLDNGAPYMVMEYLEGGDLEAWVQQRGPLEIEQAVEFILQACEALAEAHGLGMVHRDLKPSNLFCIRGTDGLLSIKVLDFGISKLGGLGATGSDMGMTRTTSVMGSPLYMSPEQMKSSRDVDARTDIWAVGIILHELLTGKVPFDGKTLAEVCVKAATQPPPRTRDYRPDVPLGVEEVILKCLQKDRAKRYANVAELAVALAPFGPKRAKASVERISRVIQAAGLSESALALPPSSEATSSSGATGTVGSWGHTTAGMGRNRVLPTVAVIGLLTIIGAIWLLLRWPAAPVASPATPTPSVVVQLAAPSATVSSAVPPITVASSQPAAAVTSVHSAIALAPSAKIAAAKNELHLKTGGSRTAPSPAPMPSQSAAAAASPAPKRAANPIPSSTPARPWGGRL